MAGLSHKDFEGRVPCPYCKGTDCTGIITVAGREVLGCVVKQREFKTAAVRASAVKHRLTEHRVAGEYAGLYVHQRIKNLKRGAGKYFVLSEADGYLADGQTIAAALESAASVLEAREHTARARQVREVALG